MKNCVTCGHRGLNQTMVNLDFNGVALVEGVVFECPECDERYEGFERVEALSRTVAHHIARRVERLTPAEVRFLRKYLGYSGKDFAGFLGVAPETVSRWESSSSPKTMTLSTEKLLRYMALNDKPICDYGLERAGTSAGESALPTFLNRQGAWVAA